jgi:ABC-type lipoprotein release transport system permease subunit
VLRWRGWNLGESIVVQEHTFVVKGVFRTGTVADNEVWVPLAEAQRMFGFGDDVSIYVLRGDEHLAERIENELPVEVTRQGEAFEDLVHSLDASVRLLRAVSVVMGIAAGLSILTVMFTMARTRRREMAILRTIGFARRDLIPYLVVPAITVTIVGYVVALIAARLLIRALNVGAFGITVTPVLDQRVAMIALLWSLGIGMGAAAYPTALITGIDMAETLRAE